MNLDCGVCVVRSWRPDDLDSLVRHANDHAVAVQLRDRFPHPYTPADGENWLSTACVRQPETNFAIDVDGAAVGGIGFEIGTDTARCSAEIGYWLGQEFWRRGIVTAALKAVTAHAIAEHRLARLFAMVRTENHASRRVLVKAGYQLEGTLTQSAIKEGKLLDQALYAFVPGAPSFF